MKQKYDNSRRVRKNPDFGNKNSLINTGMELMFNWYQKLILLLNEIRPHQNKISKEIIIFQ